MNIKKFREIIANRINIDVLSHGEWIDGIEDCWKKEIEILTEDVTSTMDFLENNCTADEYGWVSEVLDEVVEKTQSKEFLDCYKKLLSKFPEENAKYKIEAAIEDAEEILKKISTRV